MDNNINKLGQFLLKYKHMEDTKKISGNVLIMVVISLIIGLVAGYFIGYSNGVANGEAKILEEQKLEQEKAFWGSPKRSKSICES